MKQPSTILPALLAALLTLAPPLEAAATSTVETLTFGCVIAARSEVRAVPAWRAYKLRSLVTCGDILGNVIAFGLDKQGRVVCSGRGVIDAFDNLRLTVCGVTL